MAIKSVGSNLEKTWHALVSLAADAQKLGELNLYSPAAQYWSKHSPLTGCCQVSMLLLRSQSFIVASALLSRTPHLPSPASFGNVFSATGNRPSCRPTALTDVPGLMYVTAFSRTSTPYSRVQKVPAPPPPWQPRHTYSN